MSNTVHVLGIAHTVPHEDYLVCAFTTKILLFPSIIQPFGWDVVEYSNEGSMSGAREHITILSRERLRTLSKRTSREEPHDIDVHNEELAGEFQRILVERLKARARPGDIVCHVWGPNMEVYEALPQCHHVESSVGYTANPGLPFRIYESNAWMHWHYGKAGQEDGHNYKWVIPTAFDTEQWRYSGDVRDYAVFLGRVTHRKGMNILVEIARRMPELPIRVYGPGDPSQWANDAPSNLMFKGPVFGIERIDAIRHARCMLMPTVFIEPFGFSGIEAQLCGVPLIGSNFGAFTETVIEGVTGHRCNTLADWVEAIKLSASLDRRQISRLAHEKYSRHAIGKQYDWVFRQLADLSGPGWYGETSRKFSDLAAPAVAVSNKPRIWLFIPYFGTLPNYFQLYLDSLSRNAEFLSVFFMTDIDLSKYRLPANLIMIPFSLAEMRNRAALFIRDEFGVAAEADALLKQPYKLVDFKILYPRLFADIIDKYGVSQSDFVGWGDCDLIYGRFSDFLDMSGDFEIIGGYHGHLTAYRNTDAFKDLFRSVEKLPDILLDDTTHIADEIAFRPTLMAYLEANKLQMFYTNRYFCDIVPPNFFELFRKDHATRKKNFFDGYNSEKDIDYVEYTSDGRLVVQYDDGSSRESIYCHLQKRKMALEFDSYPNGYRMLENAFVRLDEPEQGKPEPPSSTGSSSAAITSNSSATDGEGDAAIDSEGKKNTHSGSKRDDDKAANLGDAGQKGLVDHHQLVAARPLHSRIPGQPRVLLAILAKQKEEALPLYLECIEELDFPKSQIVLYIRTNNNTDKTECILREWVERVRPLYAGVEFDASNVTENIQQYGVHEWNPTRFKVLGDIRNTSLKRTLEKNCDYYFVADVDNFVRPCTLRELVALDLPIVAPLLRAISPGGFYSNYHAEVDQNGYYRHCDQYFWILNEWIRGVVEVPVVHTTYLVRADVVPKLNYLDGSARHEYVVFSDTARKAAIPQYLDNRQVYGYIVFGHGDGQYVEGGTERARALLADVLKTEGQQDILLAEKPRPLVFCCFGLHGSGSTWMFNLARDICAAKSIPFASAHRDSHANLPLNEPKSQMVIAKTHNPMEDYQAFISQSYDPVVITTRDPRDAVLSFMQRFSNSPAKSFDEALAAIAYSAERIVAIKRLRDVPVFQYENGFIGDPNTVEHVAKLLGVSLSADEKNQILANLSADAVREKIQKLEKSGAIKDDAVWDRETHWHKGHVGDGKVGKWRDVLSPDQVREILDRTREYCDIFGYGHEDIVVVVKGSPRPSVTKVEVASYERKRRQTIALCMIVKNEAPIIAKCLESVRPFIDYWVIADTGSTDRTQEIILDTLKDIPGELHQRPWVNFAHNRNEALAFARSHADYSFIIDADDDLLVTPGYKLPFLKADSCLIEIVHQELRHWRPQIVSNALPWRYEGVLHEFLSCDLDDGRGRQLPPDRSQKAITGLKMVMGEGGARRRQSDLSRYLRDAEIIRNALETETDPFLISRYTFYLAQSYRDAGNLKEALTYNLKRAEQGMWIQEVYVSLCSAAKIMIELDYPVEEIIRTFVRAQETDPNRAEAYYGAARYCRAKDRFEEGYRFAKVGLKLAAPESALFHEQWIYDHGLLDEFAVCAYWIGNYDESLRASQRLIRERKIPADSVPRVENNVRLAKGKLAAAE